MPLMTLKRLPTEAELEDTGMEAHTFLDVFNENCNQGFTANVEYMDGGVILGGWQINYADWFSVSKD